MTGLTCNMLGCIYLVSLSFSLFFRFLININTQAKQSEAKLSTSPRFSGAEKEKKRYIAAAFAFAAAADPRKSQVSQVKKVDSTIIAFAVYKGSFIFPPSVWTAV